MFVYILYNNVYVHKWSSVCKVIRKSAIKTLIFLGKVLELSKKPVPLHPLSRTIAISQVDRTKLVSVMLWRAIVSKQRMLKQSESVRS